MGTYTSLDARSLAAPGGLGDRIAHMLASVGDSYARMSDNRDARANAVALRTTEDDRRDRRDRLSRMLDLAGTTGDVPGGAAAVLSPEDADLLAAVATRGKQRQADADQERQIRQEGLRALIDERQARAAAGWGASAARLGKAVQSVLPGFLGGGAPAGAGGKMGSDGLSPDELKWRQTMADRELDALGITTYSQSSAIGGERVRGLAPGKTWDHALPIYQRWGLPVPAPAAPAAPATPAATGQGPAATDQDGGQGAAPAAAPTSMPLDQVLAENEWARGMPRPHLLRLLERRGITVAFPPAPPLPDASVGPSIAAAVR